MVDRNIEFTCCLCSLIRFSLFAGNLVLTICKGPLEVIAGILFGVVMGIFLWYIPAKDNVSNAIMLIYILQ